MERWCHGPTLRLRHLRLPTGVPQLKPTFLLLLPRSVDVSLLDIFMRSTDTIAVAASESAVASQPTAPVQSPVRPSVPVQSSVNPPISVPSSIDSSDPVQHPSKPSSSVQNPVKSSVPVQSSVTFPISPGMEFERIAYYDSESQTAENITFLGNFGGQGSGVFNE